VTAAGMGVGAYGATVILLWRLASRPEGAESFVLERIKLLGAACGCRLRLWSRN
jgi:hypothetical protein